MCVYWGRVVQKSPPWERCKGNPSLLGTLKALFAHLNPAPFPAHDALGLAPGSSNCTSVP